MSIPFEARYIRVKYINKSIIGSIKTSKYPIGFEKTGDNEYSIEVITYSKLDTGESGQLAFRFLEKTTKSVPCFSKGDKTELISVKDPDSDNVWWIENGDWKDTKNVTGSKIIYRDSPICRTVGKSKVFIADTVCLIQVNSSGFTYNQLTEYIEDFRISLSELIIDEGSHVFANAKDKKIKIVNNDFLEFLRKFIGFTEKIIANPKVELRETQRILNYKKVRPIPKTFMEIASQGIKKQLTSRDYIETYDVAENRYIYAIVNRIYFLLNTLIHVTKRKKEIEKKEIESLKKRLNQFSDKIKINEDSCKAHILNLEEKIEIENHQIINIKSKSSVSNYDYVDNRFETHYRLETLYIKIQSKEVRYENNIQFYVDIKKNTNDDWFKLQEGHGEKVEFDGSLFNGYFQQFGEYKVVAVVNRFNPTPTLHVRKFSNVYKISPLCSNYTICVKVMSTPKVNDDNTFGFYGEGKLPGEAHWFKLKKEYSILFKFDRDLFDGFFHVGNEYKITGCIAKSDKVKQDNSGKIFFRRFFKIDDIAIIHSIFQNDIKKYNKEIETLKRNSWERDLTDSESEDQRREINSIKRRIEHKDIGIKERDSILYDFQHLLPKFKNIRSFFKKNNVRKNNHFPGSMTFIQNAEYLGAHKSYKRINDASGINEDLYDTLLKSEEIGILDIPLIYERWCLLQIIKILTTKYGFHYATDDWKKDLLQLVVKNKYNIELLFENKEIGKKINFSYEKKLKNGNRPDFILEISSIDANNSPRHKLILDAKFREDVQFPGEVSDLMYELYDEKDYSEGGKNFVYILHPSINAVKAIKTPQDWGRNSYYGEDSLSEDEDKPCHKYGAVLVSPFCETYHSNLDDLDRLIGLFLQYMIEDNDLKHADTKKIDTKPNGKIFCIICGSYKCSLEQQEAGHKKMDKKDMNKKYMGKCDDCDHFFVINYCGNCKNRLWKHGIYWTYHKTHSFEPYNVQCPSCGTLLAQRKEED